MELNKLEKINSIISTLVKEIEKQKKHNTNIVVAIDGDCCSGKTTLTTELNKRMACNIIHVDDFYLPMSLRSEERFKQPGRNIHWEKLQEEILEPISKDEQVTYTKFLPKKKVYSEKISLENNQLTLVEGTYCMLPELQPYYDIKIFLSVNKKIQHDRLTCRESESKVIEFTDIWIPKSTKYFKEYEIKDKSHFIFDTTTINEKEGKIIE